MAQAQDRQQPLADALGNRPLPTLDAIDEVEIRALADAVRSARQHQRAQFERALQAALGHLPALLRAPVRKVLFP
jgi:hypothetical protein